MSSIEAKTGFVILNRKRKMHKHKSKLILILLAVRIAMKNLTAAGLMLNLVHGCGSQQAWADTINVGDHDNELLRSQAAQQEPPQTAPAFAADQGIYAYADWGSYMYSNSPKGSSMDGIRIGGGYHFNPYAGVEAGLSIIDIVQNSSSGTCYSFFSTCPQDSLSASSYQYSFVGTMPNGLFVKLGRANTSFDYSYSYTPCFFGFCSPSITGSGSATKTNPMFGIGWQSTSKKPLYWRAQYENFGTIKMTTTFSDHSSKTYDIGIEVISLGIIYNF